MNRLSIRLYKWALFAGIVLVCASCNRAGEKTQQGNHPQNDAGFEISDFRPLSNVASDTGLVHFDLDYAGALTNGFIIPSARQVPGGKFTFTFSVTNTSGAPASFRYKIYYQDESYKMDERNPATGKEHEWAFENFYGSWEDTHISFRSTGIIPADGTAHLVTDSFRIVGNPRNESRYFDGTVNQRWKRNPRVGSYSFLLAVCSEQIVESGNVPEYISNISSTDNGRFVNPYYYFLYGAGSTMHGVRCIRSGDRLALRARPDPGSGIYIQPHNFDSSKFSSSFNSCCGQDSVLYAGAAFEQFINNIDPSMRFDNIPVVRDVMADDYTYTDYNWDMAFYSRDETISTLPGVARKPCETVISDPVTHKITLINPGCHEGTWRKQSVGIRTRNGLTYGKYRMKCKLTQLLNKNNIWNGLTNAIWLLNQQGGGSWNNRRPCRNAGYMASYWGGDTDKRVETVDYSEIDFEILKTPPYCPSWIFPPVIHIPSPNPRDVSAWNVRFPDDLKGSEPMITVACTNWDMACWEPAQFNSGCNEIIYAGNTFSSHRWTKEYRALTQKQYEPDDELFAGEYYYFEIDWRPKEIIWRIGPTPDRMRVVGYMNDSISMIPNNQMTLIVTQEYHNTKWWPGSPFIQENIPFPLNDLIGEVYELVIE